MFYPKFIKENGTVGICALSAGLGHKIEDYLNAYNYLVKRGIHVLEEGNIRVDNVRGGSIEERVNALHSLYLNDDVDMVMCGAGGDFLYEILPYIDLKIIRNHPKFFMGASDPTGITFMITTKLDIASIYGLNGGSYYEGQTYIDNNFKMICGNLITQYSYEYYQSTDDYGTDRFNEPVYWHNDLKESGRCIGGCLDVLKDMIGTPFEDVSGFVERYKDDGIIWYFDIYAMNAENTYRTLLQMKAAGWFKYCKAVLIGRVLFEGSDTGMTYSEAYSLALGNIPHAYNLDIGHTLPKMTLINGAILDVEVKDGKGRLNFRLE